MPPLKKHSLVDQVYDKLRTDIVTLHRPFGSKLNVNELQAELGVSCTPIREAINRLQQQGLVVYQNNIGAHVLELDVLGIREINQLALTLHCAAIRFAMNYCDHTVLVSELEKQLEKYCDAKTVVEEVSAISDFIGVFYHNCGNRLLDNSMLSIQGLQLLLRYIYAYSTQERAADTKEFQLMVEGVRRGNAEAVCSALRVYVAHSTPTIEKYVDSNR